ncbi:MAG: hypothetical protein JWQ07_5096 [Ramlibacter sp.]|nr:hypothetical protein [Ramlibacter sp.]
MKTEFEMLSAKHRAGDKLGTEEIRSLMTYALELLKEFERHTDASIEYGHQLIAEQYRKAA